MAKKPRVKANPFHPNKGSFWNVTSLFLLLNENSHVSEKPHGFMEECVGSGVHRAAEA